MRGSDAWEQRHHKAHFQRECIESREELRIHAQARAAEEIVSEVYNWRPAFFVGGFKDDSTGELKPPELPATMRAPSPDRQDMLTHRIAQNGMLLEPLSELPQSGLTDKRTSRFDTVAVPKGEEPQSDLRDSSPHRQKPAAQKKPVKSDDKAQTQSASATAQPKDAKEPPKAATEPPKAAKEPPKAAKEPPKAASPVSAKQTELDAANARALKLEEQLAAERKRAADLEARLKAADVIANL